MVKYILRRFAYMLIMLLLVSFVAFFLVQLPPGDYVTTYINDKVNDGEKVSLAEVEALRAMYGLDRSFLYQYWKWIGNIMQGELGRSFGYGRPVKDLLSERLGLTVMISIATLIFTYLLAVPIGIYSATHQYSYGDYTASFLGFIGMATPNFILALILMLIFNKLFGLSIGGLFSQEFQGAAWSFAKLWDLIKHLPIPIVVIGTAGTASVIRTLRATLLDELRKQYVITARAKGVEERKLVFKYPVRIAINPMVSSMSGILVGIVSGSTITATVLNLPTMGPLLLDSLLKQDVYLSGAIILFQCVMVFLGTFLSDMLLIAVDPRIKYDK
ncbi:MAG: ABC transporter permease [Spirochaetales bacterium]|nr:ABC transporter permease [Spirochaetales bacterium]